MVNYKTNIRFINSHSKSDCCHNHIYIFHKKHILMFGSGFSI